MAGAVRAECNPRRQRGPLGGKGVAMTPAELINHWNRIRWNEDRDLKCIESSAAVEVFREYPAYALDTACWAWLDEAKARAHRGPTFATAAKFDDLTASVIVLADLCGLSVPSIPAFLVATTDGIGTEHLAVRDWSPRFVEAFGLAYFDVVRLLSLADRISHLPGARFTPGELAIIRLLPHRDTGQRMTTEQIISALGPPGAVSLGNTKTLLSGLGRRRLIDNRQDTNPPGFARY